MDSAQMKDNINVTELLIQISRDVASIKTDMANIKETQKAEKENTAREIEDVRTDFKKEMIALEAKLAGRVDSLQNVQTKLFNEVDILKHADESKDAKRWRTVLAYIATAVGGMFVAKLPDFFLTLFK